MTSEGRRPFAYATSHRMDEVMVTLADGFRREILLKELEEPRAGTRRPGWLVDPAREVIAYQVLAGSGLGAPACLGIDAGWLLLEKVHGVPLWQCGDLDHWINAARWLAAFHLHFASNLPPRDNLLVYDERYFRVWPERALGLHPEVARFTAGYERVVDLLMSVPTTFVHGEFYPSNVVVDGERIAPVDWEMSGVGPGLLDLAALVTGWSGAERAAIVAAYGNVPADALGAAEVHLAMQWLGWSPGWTPPAEHARDWLAELERACEKVGL